MSGQQGYSAEEHARAWASYYAQQGMDSATIAATTGYNPTTGIFDPTYASAAASSSTSNAYASSSSAAAAPGQWQSTPAIPLLDQDMLQQSMAYEPGSVAQQEFLKSSSSKAAKPGYGKRETVVRKINGKVWEDPTLIDWDPKWHRLFVGNVSNDVNEKTLNTAFDKYPSYCKCKVIKDRLSEKSKYAFIAFKDPEDFLRAWKEMDGKYVGNRPIRLTKVKDDKYGSIATVEIGAKRAKMLDKVRKNKGRPLDGRPVPY